MRIAIGIGEDCDFCVLEEFVGNSEIKAFAGEKRGKSYRRYIKWASAVLIKNVAIAPSLPVDFSKFRYTNILQIPTPLRNGSLVIFAGLFGVQRKTLFPN